MGIGMDMVILITVSLTREIYLLRNICVGGSSTHLQFVSCRVEWSCLNRMYIFSKKMVHSLEIQGTVAPGSTLKRQRGDAQSSQYMSLVKQMFAMN